MTIATRPGSSGPAGAAVPAVAAGRVAGRHAPWDEAEARAIIAGFDGVPGAMLPILHALQEAFGCVPEAAKPLIAQALNLSRAEVHGVVTFYHDYRAEPAGRHVLKLCRAEACQSVGGTALHRDVLAKLGLEWGGTTPDGRLTVEAVYCLGLCATAPAALLDGTPLGRLDAARLDGVVAEAMAT
jgi:formate dehydrogenase subunit gamma